MTHYVALVRLYYLVDGKKTCAPANTIAFDFPEDEVEANLAKGYIREATIGEVAEAEAKAAAAPKKAAVKPKRAAKADKGEPEKKPEPEKKADAGAGEKSDDKTDLA